MAKSKRSQLDFEIYESDPIAGIFGVRIKISHSPIRRSEAQGLGVEKFWKAEMTEDEAEKFLEEIYRSQKREADWGAISRRRKKGA